MHELSIAESLVELIRRHLPAHRTLLHATVRIGPMHGIVPEAMRLAWKLASAQAGWPTARLIIDSPPWRLRCVSCGRCWEPTTVDEHCLCGSVDCEILGGDEFQLVSIDVREPSPSHRRKTAPTRHAGMTSSKAGVYHEHQSSHR